jgi:hypothetical protein
MPHGVDVWREPNPRGARCPRFYGKWGPRGLVAKLPQYVQPMKEGYSNSEACRVLGVSRNTVHRWLHGRNGVEGLVQQGLDPRPRMACPATGRSNRYLSEDERIFIADRDRGCPSWPVTPICGSSLWSA